MTLARRYAVAALGAHGAEPMAPLEAAAAGLQAAIVTPVIAAALANPQLGRVRGLLVATTAAKACGAPVALKNLLGVLATNRRLHLLPEVLSAMQALLAERAGLVVADLQAAQALNEIQKIQLKAKIKLHSKARDVRLCEQVKPELLGGFRAFWHGWVWDASVQGQLQVLAAKLRQSAQS
jgi:F-type H+-transporting ATPase subunit delta